MNHRPTNKSIHDTLVNNMNDGDTDKDDVCNDIYVAAIIDDDDDDCVVVVVDDHVVLVDDVDDNNKKDENFRQNSNNNGDDDNGDDPESVLICSFDALYELENRFYNEMRIKNSNSTKEITTNATTTATTKAVPQQPAQAQQQEHQLDQIISLVQKEEQSNEIINKFVMDLMTMIQCKKKKPNENDDHAHYYDIGTKTTTFESILRRMIQRGDNSRSLLSWNEEENDNVVVVVDNHDHKQETPPIRKMDWKEFMNEYQRILQVIRSYSVQGQQKDQQKGGGSTNDDTVDDERKKMVGDEKKNDRTIVSPFEFHFLIKSCIVSHTVVENKKDHHSIISLTTLVCYLLLNEYTFHFDSDISSLMQRKKRWQSILLETIHVLQGTINNTTTTTLQRNTKKYSLSKKQMILPMDLDDNDNTKNDDPLWLGLYLLLSIYTHYLVPSFTILQQLIYDHHLQEKKKDDDPILTSKIGSDTDSSSLSSLSLSKPQLLNKEKKQQQQQFNQDDFLKSFSSNHGTTHTSDHEHTSVRMNLVFIASLIQCGMKFLKPYMINENVIQNDTIEKDTIISDGHETINHQEGTVSMTSFYHHMSSTGTTTTTATTSTTKQILLNQLFKSIIINTMMKQFHYRYELMYHHIYRQYYCEILLSSLRDMKHTTACTTSGGDSGSRHDEIIIMYITTNAALLQHEQSSEDDEINYNEDEDGDDKSMDDDKRKIKSQKKDGMLSNHRLLQQFIQSNELYQISWSDIDIALLIYDTYMNDNKNNIEDRVDDTSTYYCRRPWVWSFSYLWKLHFPYVVTFLRASQLEQEQAQAQQHCQDDQDMDDTESSSNYHEPTSFSFAASQYQNFGYKMLYHLLETTPDGSLLNGPTLVSTRRRETERVPPLHPLNPIGVIQLILNNLVLVSTRLTPNKQSNTRTILGGETSNHHTDSRMLSSVPLDSQQCYQLIDSIIKKYQDLHYQFQILHHLIVCIIMVRTDTGCFETAYIPFGSKLIDSFRFMIQRVSFSSSFSNHQHSHTFVDNDDNNNNNNDNKGKTNRYCYTNSNQFMKCIWKFIHSTFDTFEERHVVQKCKRKLMLNDHDSHDSTDSIKINEIDDETNAKIPITLLHQQQLSEPYEYSLKEVEILIQDNEYYTAFLGLIQQMLILHRQTLLVGNSSTVVVHSRNRSHHELDDYHDGSNIIEHFKLIQLPLQRILLALHRTLQVYGGNRQQQTNVSTPDNYYRLYLLQHSIQQNIDSLISFIS